MHPFRRIAAIISASLALIPGTAQPAAGPTAQQESLSSALARMAPLALSGDGAWVAFLDADNVLHRQDVRDPARVQRMPMPPGTATLAASRSAGRVAFTAGWGCAGWVDFRAPYGPVLHWVPGITPRRPAPDNFGSNTPDVLVCTESYTPALALSADGRLLATATQVVDLDTGSVLATLPQGSATLRLQFTDQDRKLLAATAILGDTGDGYRDPGLLQFSVWDLKTGALRRLVSDGATPFEAPQRLLHDFSNSTATLAQVVQRPGKGADTFDVTRQPLGACRSGPAVQFSFTGFDWHSMLVDPHGRWIAAVRSLKNASTTGLVEELTVYDLVSRQPVSTLRSKQALRGLVAASDGATIYALASTVHDDFGAPSFERGGTLVSHAVNVAALRGTARAPASWDEAPCLVEDETAAARALPAPDPERLLPLRWTVPLATDAVDDAQDGAAARALVMADGTIWLNQHGDMARLDPATGQAVATRPVPRHGSVAGFPVPEADGFVSVKGDTVSWQPFNHGATTPPAWKTVDRRAGWDAGNVRAAGRRIVVDWVRPDGSDGDNVTVAIYTVGDFRHLRDVRTERGAQEYAALDPQHAALTRLPCTTFAGEAMAGYDWRWSHFGSNRAYDCDGLAGARTVYWSGLDIAPLAGAGIKPMAQAARGITGAIGVAIEGTRLHVHDIIARRVLGQVALSDAGTITAISIVAGAGLVLVESEAMQDGSVTRALRAYSYPRKSTAQ